ncbi:MAG: thiamine-binding protein [Firmicutes bacterium]|nr:thiamine-binding protein [Bacillota bacterium]
MRSAMSIQVLPLSGAAKEEVYALVDKAIRIIQESGLPYVVNPFDTTVEGEFQDLLQLAGKAHEAVLAAGCNRVFTVIKLASAPDLGTSAEKVAKYR